MARCCELTNKGNQAGNKVSHAQNKSKRSFSVNLQKISLRSEILKENVRLRIAASTLRSVDHNGGLDNYLLTTSNTKLSEEAIRIKRKLKKVLVAKN